MQALSNTETISLGAVSLACLAILIGSLRNNGEPLLDSLAISGLAFAFSYCSIRWCADAIFQKGFKGRDMSKKVPVEIPEFMGVLPALVYILAISSFMLFAFKGKFIDMTSGAGNKDEVLEAQQNETGRDLHLVSMEKLTPYGFAGLTVLAAIVLGIMDDIFDLRWRVKFPIPAVASIPLLAVYAVKYGETHVMVPVPLRAYLGERTELGVLYYVYMASLTVFSTNCINILAGVNGIEVGQSLVIACLIVLNDALYLSPNIQQPHPAAEAHLLSIYLLLPFIGVSLALLFHNWFPAKVFVGDTYCYFAGMVFAVVAILGHFSKTLLLVFIPQIFNFVYSTPQLFGLVPCPRHRLPRFNADTGLLEPSVATFTEERPLRPIVGEVLKILHKLKLVRVAVDETTGRVTETSNLTILNLWLVWRGPLREDRLAVEILTMQTACGLAGLWVRHSLALMLFAVDNRF